MWIRLQTAAEQDFQVLRSTADFLSFLLGALEFYFFELLLCHLPIRNYTSIVQQCPRGTHLRVLIKALLWDGVS
ncbi:hypothetical protein GJAV_G00199250 [Gymnothorax javanicus]|nr:hypothetical protein GJAV_G00199250 [Gymnothorax javanicus]